jgi:hypothetical protein
VPDYLKAPAINKVARLGLSAAQLVLDEWAAIFATDWIENPPLGNVLVCFMDGSVVDTASER